MARPSYDKTMRIQYPCSMCGKMILVGACNVFNSTECDACAGVVGLPPLNGSAGGGMRWPIDYLRQADEVRAEEDAQPGSEG